ncbi:hypothetical protein QP905_08090 [Corynebacterium pseudodiphtheriticum]|uniref:hypothetical protein n=1 Tax=Corynebacterium pseudodiphtheriticum TaxID=37637 RepID=UPI00254A3596|nr:hypothetical protein [Corynebacterium pseudodiphtheriticum]MDK8578305.1 hypothetical protein [Corynebacterium pseudodiphtheriticum]
MDIVETFTKTADRFGLKAEIHETHNAAVFTRENGRKLTIFFRFNENNDLAGYSFTQHGDSILDIDYSGWIEAFGFSLGQAYMKTVREFAENAPLSGSVN